MTRIKRTVVASGVIGLYDHEWKITRVYDIKLDSEFYTLEINKGYYFETCDSIVEALSLLVENFKE